MQDLPSTCGIPGRHAALLAARRGRSSLARVGRWAVVAAAFAAAQAPAAWGSVAAPNGRAGGACTDSDLCDVRSALRAAGQGGEVALRSGTYDLRGAPQLVIESSVWMHGPIGGPRPVLLGDASGGVVRVADRAAVLEHVAVEPVAGARRGIEATSGVARDVIVHVTATGAAACELVNGMVVSTVCWSSGSGGSGVVVDASSHDAAGVVVSSTIVGQAAVRLSSSAGFSGTVAIDSSILLGLPGGHDIVTSGVGAQRVITSYANFDDAVGPGLQSIGGDQRAVPALVDPANGDFRQSAGSPTIDAGSPVNNIDHGQYDIEGDQRVLGGRLDMGADEFGPPRLDDPAPGGAVGQPPRPTGGAVRETRPRSTKPARLTRLRVVVHGSAAAARRTVGSGRILFRLDHAASVRLTLTRIGRRSDQRTSVVVRGKTGANDMSLSRHLGRGLRRRGTYLLAARPKGGKTLSVKFRIGRGPERFASAG
jgi:hypothetical protein